MKHITHEQLNEALYFLMLNGLTFIEAIEQLSEEQI